MRLIFYRYERDDGGGPYFTRDGQCRTSCFKSQDNILSGFLNIRDLRAWAYYNKSVLDGCALCKYEGELLRLTNISGEAIFAKDTAIKIGEI